MIILHVAQWVSSFSQNLLVTPLLHTNSNINSLLTYLFSQLYWNRQNWNPIDCTSLKCTICGDTCIYMPMKPLPQSREWINLSMTLKIFMILLVIPVHLLLPSIPRPPLTYFLLLKISLHFLEFYMNGTMLFLYVFVCLLSLCIIILRLIQIVLYINSVSMYCWVIQHSIAIW